MAKDNTEKGIQFYNFLSLVYLFIFYTFATEICCFCPPRRFLIIFVLLNLDKL